MSESSSSLPPISIAPLSSSSLSHVFEAIEAEDPEGLRQVLASIDGADCDPSGVSSAGLTGEPGINLLSLLLAKADTAFSSSDDEEENGLIEDFDPDDFDFEGDDEDDLPAPFSTDAEAKVPRREAGAVYLGMADLLVRYGADAAGTHLLGQYAERGSLEVVEFLLDHGADVEMADASGRTPLQTATRSLLDHAAGSDGSVDAFDEEYDGLPPELPADCERQAAIVRLLADRGADLNRLDATGEGILHLACAAGQASVVEFLLRLGCSPELRDGQGRTAFFHVFDRQSVHALIRHKADPCATCPQDGTTPLHHAARHDDAEVCEELLDFGAPVESKDHAGDTPLFLTHSPECVSLFLGAGADINARDAQGRTPLHRACATTDPIFVIFLVSRGADMNARDNEGATPLDLASSETISSLLLRRGAKA